MSDSTGWYARKLGQPQPQPQHRPATQQGGVMLPGRPQQQPQAPMTYQQPQYQPQTQYPDYGNHVQAQQYQQPTQVVQFAGHQYAGAEQYRGGIGQQMNPDPCPQCGGNQYFANIKTKGRGPAPAGHCFNCGYNELFDQGDQGSWGQGQAVVQSGEPVQMAAIQVTASPFQGSLQG